MSDGSYSYYGSYTGDYSYSYSYSDAGSEGTAEKSPAPSKVAAAARSRNAAAKPATPPRSSTAAPANKDSGDSYSYSYSYSTSGSAKLPAPAVTGGRGAAPPPVPAVPRPKAAAAAPPKPAADSGSYSYSYSDDGSYSYSYTESDSQTETNVPAARQAPPAGAASRGPKPPAAAAAAPPRGPASSGSYSYSYTGDSYSYSDEADTYYYSDGSSYYYSYSDDSYSYTGDSSYYYSYSGSDAGAGQQRAGGSGYSDDYYYSSDYYDGSDSYYYSGDSYYSDDYYSYSGDADSYYYDSYSYSSYTGSEGYHHHATNGARHRQRGDSGSGSSYTYSASGKSPTSTTSSYGYSSSAASVMSETATAAERDLMILRAPAKDVPRPPSAPKRCFVAPKSIEDSVWAFLQRLMTQQQAYEARRAAGTTATAAPVSFVQRTTTTTPATRAGAALTATEGGADAAEAAKASADKKSKSKLRLSLSKKRKDAAAKEVVEEEEEEEEAQNTPDTPFITTKDGCFSERSVRIAFGVLRLNHLERREALKCAPVPVPMETMLDVFNACVVARAKERVAQAFLAHDTYRSGEVSVAELSTLLRRLGLGTSPVMDGYRISLGVSAEGAPEMVMHVEHLVQPEAPPAQAQGEEGVTTTAAAAAPPPPAAGSLQWEVTPVYVSRIVRRSAASKESTPVRWEHNTLFMGRHAIIRGVGSEALFQRLKTYVEAATYLCVLANVYAIDDAERGTVTVQYPQFIRSVLLAEPPAHRHQSSTAAAPPPPRKLLYIENLFQAVFRPMEVLHAHEAGRPVPRYHNAWALESTLFSTKDTEEKRRRNVVPGISADNVRVIPAPPTRPDGEVQLAFVVQKVRVPARPPAHARCFCLVSAVTPGNVFLPAIEVPVRHVVASSKKDGEYTWVFHDKKHKKHAAALCFAGPALDRIYVECCYETRDDVRPGGVGDGEHAAAPSPASGGTTVWCAGYVVFAVDGATSAVLPVQAGSLLQPEPASATAPPSSTPVAGNADAGAKESKSRTGPLRWLAKLSQVAQRAKKRNAEKLAHNVKIEVLKSSRKAITGGERLPARYIAFQRHVAMIAMLRGAVERVAKETTYALQAFRQQAVRFIFAVAADPALLDQLCALWAYRERHWSKAERKDDAQKQQALLASVAALYALNNSCAGSKGAFAKSLQKGKTPHIAIDPAAPMVPIRV